MMQRAAELIRVYCCPNKTKSTTCIIWFPIISREFYILLSNLLCVLSNSSSCYAMGLFSQSYLFCLLSIAYCSEVMCLVSALSPLLSYISPLMTSSALQPCSPSSYGNGSSYSTFLQCLFMAKFTAVMTSQVLITC